MSNSLNTLLDVMRALRDPVSGCSWDRKQTHASLAKYAIEEAYEVADAVRSADDAKLCDELGDLLFQVVFQAQVASERGVFDFNDVAQAIADKLTRRHPHVFGPNAGQMSEDEVAAAWEKIKAAERGERGESGESGLLADVSAAQPAMLRAQKIQQRMAGVGYDWQSAREVLAALKTEIDELDAAMAQAQVEAIEDELGDVLFSVVNLARWLKLDGEQALQASCEKITARVNWIESELARSNLKMSQLPAEILDDYWSQAKRALKSST